VGEHSGQYETCVTPIAKYPRPIAQSGQFMQLTSGSGHLSSYMNSLLNTRVCWVFLAMSCFSADIQKNFINTSADVSPLTQ
jgi:hypothetical protein